MADNVLRNYVVRLQPFNEIGSTFGSLSAFSFLFAMSLKGALSGSWWGWPMAVIFFVFILFYWLMTSLVIVTQITEIEDKRQVKLLSGEFIVIALLTVLVIVGVVFLSFKSVFP